MSTKKVVSRNVALAIGVLCIVLVAVLVAVLVRVVFDYTLMLNNKDSQIADLQSQVKFDDSTVDRLTAIVNLANSTIWVNNMSISQPAGNSSSTYTSWAYSVSYAGYVVVNVLSSSNPDTYVELKYSWSGVNYDNTVNVGSSGLAWFPVLPADNIAVRVINENLSTSASETVTITYWY
jgi:hypothetical protein